jgi:hypothetical protein
MEVMPNNIFDYGDKNLHIGMCGPNVYVSNIWCDMMEETSYNYWNNERRWKATIECKSPEMLNLVLGTIKNMAHEDPVEVLTKCAQAEWTKTINDELNAYLESNGLILNIEFKSKKYKLKHKILKN